MTLAFRSATLSLKNGLYGSSVPTPDRAARIQRSLLSRRQFVFGNVLGIARWFSSWPDNRLGRARIL
jgi:hypothetical protein